MITVIIPFFDKDSYRRRNLAAVVDNFMFNYPDFEIIIAEQLSDSTYIKSVLIPIHPLLKHVQIKVGSDRFNKSYVINQTIRNYATYDIIMMSDADCIIPKIENSVFITELIKHSVYFPFSRVNFLNEAHTRRYIKGNPLIQSAHKQDLFINRYTGLINVFNKTTFDVVGGFDEEFEGWGGEDDAFVDKCNRLVSPIKRCTGDVELLHLYHPKTNNVEYTKSECFTWNKKRVAAIRRMSDNELQMYVADVIAGKSNPLESIVREYDAAGRLNFNVNLKIGTGSIAIDTTVYAITSTDGEIGLKEILQAVVNTDGLGFLEQIIDLIDDRIENMTDEEVLIVEFFRSMYS
jgi:hypothetical protein